MTDLNTVHMNQGEDFEPFLSIAQRAGIFYYSRFIGTGGRPGVPAKEVFPKRGVHASLAYAGKLYAGKKRHEHNVRMEFPPFIGQPKAILDKAGIPEERQADYLPVIEARLRGHHQSWERHEIIRLNRVFDGLLVARRPSTAQALAVAADAAFAYHSSPNLLLYVRRNGFGRAEESVEREFHECRRIFQFLAAALSTADMAALEKAHAEFVGDE